MKVTKQRPQIFFCFILWLPFLSVKLNNKELGQGKLFVGLGRQKEQWKKWIFSQEKVYDSATLQQSGD